MYFLISFKTFRISQVLGTTITFLQDVCLYIKYNLRYQGIMETRNWWRGMVNKKKVRHMWLKRTSVANIMNVTIAASIWHNVDWGGVWPSPNTFLHRTVLEGWRPLWYYHLRYIMIKLVGLATFYSKLMNTFNFLTCKILYIFLLLIFFLYFNHHIQFIYLYFPPLP